MNGIFKSQGWGKKLFGGIPCCWSVQTPTVNPLPSKAGARENQPLPDETLHISPCEAPGQEWVGGAELAPTVCRQPVPTALGLR